jgi:predicted Zn-dependent protease
LKTRGQDLAEALAAVEAAERRGLRGATLLTWKAEILAGLGRAGEAETAAREALRVDPEARTARLVLAGLRARAGDGQGAARHLRHLLALPDLPPDLRREAEARLRALAPAP